MAESADNVRFLCEHHAPKRGVFEGDPKVLIGKFVKRCFTANDGRKEHMWVKVTEVTADGVLRGKLDNDPVCVHDVKCGDTVTVRPEDIEEVLG